jgi:penicillin-binding protein 1C
VQQGTEQLVKNYVNRIRLLGIQNAAVLVVNNQTGAVEAYVGSADFGNRMDGGQVDGVRAVRSPGSALKPLLYALAFDEGLITPKSKLHDVPTNFGGYEPANYDQRFNGPVTAEFALANSLNIPAVKLLRDIGTTAMVEKLRLAGFATVAKQRADLGLSLILGGCGVTLEEMTRLYVALANGGKLAPLFFVGMTKNNGKNEEGTTLVSPESAFLVTNTLTQITRPDLPNNFDNSYHLPRIAWKTGTSYGRRDAWSIGYNRHYTVGVWVGNFSGAGVPELSGANTATPLLFSIFNAIDYNSPVGWFKPPKGLALRQVCPETGDLPGEFCAGRAVDYHIMGVSRTQRCQHLKPVWTDSLARISYCVTCKPEAGAIERYCPNPAPEVIAYYETKRLPYQKIPPHNPACERVYDVGAPQITSPTAGSTYYINAKNPAQLALTCQAENDVRTVYWYLNDKLLRRASPIEAVFFQSRPGRLKIACADDRGRHSELVVTVLPE